MAVNGGAGNAISISEIQTFYGGSNPAALSEYYRNGSEVRRQALTAVQLARQSIILQQS